MTDEDDCVEMLFLWLLKSTQWMHCHKSMLQAKIFCQFISKIQICSVLFPRQCLTGLGRVGLCCSCLPLTCCVGWGGRGWVVTGAWLVSQFHWVLCTPPHTRLQALFSGQWWQILLPAKHRLWLVLPPARQLWLVESKLTWCCIGWLWWYLWMFCDQVP